MKAHKPDFPFIRLMLLIAIFCFNPFETHKAAAMIPTTSPASQALES
jgi:hypothetical protein